MLDSGSNGLAQLRKLPFGACHLSLAVPEDSQVKSAADLDGCRIATSYPALTSSILSKRGISAQTVKFSGSVEIAPGLGTADAISDLVSTGTTLRANHLVELELLFESTAALYGNKEKLTAEKQVMTDRLLSRLDGVLLAAESKYVMLHAPRDAVDEITRLLPGAENPSLMNLEGDPDRVALHAVCRETVFWEHLEALKGAGASAILVLPVEKMLA
jgi:ATP phosphoribosyltransferase